MFTIADSTTFVPGSKIVKRIMVFYTPMDAWGTELLLNSDPGGARTLTEEFGATFIGAKTACLRFLQTYRINLDSYADCMHEILSRRVTQGFTSFRGFAAIADAARAVGHTRPGYTSSTGHMFLNSLAFKDIDEGRPPRPYLRDVRVLLFLYCPVVVPRL